MPDVTIIGLHPADVTDDILDQAITTRHGLVALNPDPDVRHYADFSTRRSLGSIVLVEMLIRNRDKTMYMGDFGQSDGELIGPNDPVAYGEAFLSEDGNQRLADFLDQVRTRDVRVAFFLHDFRPGRPIRTSYGLVPPPQLTAMPERLRRLVPYVLPNAE